MAPAERARPGVDPVGMEPVLDDELARGVPVLGGRLVVDRRGQAKRPGAGRAVDAQLGATQRVRVRGHLGAEIEQAPADLGEREDRRGLTGAAPSPPGAQPARVRDRGVAGLGGQEARSTGGCSAIGATWASESIRSVAGSTGNTAVGRPAAAHTTA